MTIDYKYKVCYDLKYKATMTISINLVLNLNSCTRRARLLFVSCNFT